MPMFVDGQPRGKAPAAMVDLNEGEHVVEVRRNEPVQPTWRQTVRVSANQQVKVQAQTRCRRPPRLADRPCLGERCGSDDRRHHQAGKI